MGFLILSRKIPVHYLQLGHDCFLPHPLQFITYLHIINHHYTVRGSNSIYAEQKTTDRAVNKLKMTTQNFVQVSHTNF